MYDGPLPPGPKSKAEPDLRTVHCVALDQKTGVSYYVVRLAVPERLPEVHLVDVLRCDLDLDGTGNRAVCRT
jgi:hypothetical protein